MDLLILEVAGECLSGKKKKEMDTLCLVRARRAKNDRRLGTGKTSSSAVRLVIEASFLLQCVLHLKKL